MPNKHITVTEYDDLFCGGGHEKSISQSAFDELTDLIEKSPDSDDIDHGSIFWQRGKSLKVRHFVGIIQTSDGTQIEILPKIARLNHDHVKVRAIVLSMLREVHDLPNKSGQNADLVTDKLPLLELFIRDFLNEVQHLVKRGIRSDYVRQNDNSPFLKGKLLIPKQLNYNLIRQDRFYVEYDSFEPDRPENRLIKSSLQKVYKLSREFGNQRLARELLFAFDDIPLSANYRQDFQQCSQDRGMHYYQNSLMWCRLILQNESPVPQVGERLFRSFLFPMFTLFERYVANMCKRHLKDWQITTQARDKKLLVRNNPNDSNDAYEKMIELKPDLLFKRYRRGKEKVVIADTKWKLIGANNTSSNKNVRKNKYGISEADLYQLFSYAKYYNSNHVILIYPKTDSFKEPLCFDYIDQQCQLDLWPIDLERAEDSIKGLCRLVEFSPLEFT